MTRLINADDLIQILIINMEGSPLYRAAHIVNEMPTVDAVPIAWLQNHITTIEQQRLLDEWAERKEE